MKYITCSLKCGALLEKEILGLDRRQRLLLFWEISYCFGVDSILEEVAGFSPLWFPRGKLFVYLVSCDVLIDVLVILSVKRSYDHNASLIDENLTWYQS